jgi:pimeloyl-ACP methyl ester carboxylesterase
MLFPKQVWADINGVRLHHLDWPGDDPPVVCLHGLTGNAHNFDGLARALTPARRLLALDLRGRGQSGWADEGTYTVSQYVDDLERWLEGLALKRVVLVGTSMGGVVAVLFAARRPARVERLVLNDVGPVVDSQGLERIRSSVGTAPEIFPDLSAVARWFRENYPGQRLTDDQVREWAGFATRPLEQGGLGWRCDPAIRKKMNAGEPTTDPADLWPTCEAIRCPTLVVRGATSDLLSPGTVQEMRRRMAECASVEVPGVGHAPALTEPEALAPLRRFIGSPAATEPRG